MSVSDPQVRARRTVFISEERLRRVFPEGGLAAGPGSCHAGRLPLRLLLVLWGIRFRFRLLGIDRLRPSLVAWRLRIRLGWTRLRHARRLRKPLAPAPRWTATGWLVSVHRAAVRDEVEVRRGGWWPYRRPRPIAGMIPEPNPPSL